MTFGDSLRRLITRLVCNIGFVPIPELCREGNGLRSSKGKEWGLGNRVRILSGNELEIRGHVMYGLIKLVVMRNNANSI